MITPVLTRLRRCATAPALALLFAGCSSEDLSAPMLPVNDAAIHRGAELVEGLAACRFCHGTSDSPGTALGGGRQLADKYGELQAPNISLSSNGIGGWSERDLVRLFRSHTRPDESRISSQFHRGFDWLSDADLTATIAYLRTLPASDNQVERREISFFQRNTTGFADGATDVKGIVPRISPSFKVEYGGYLADNVARCGSCHSDLGGFLASEKHLAGGQTISFDGQTKVAPAIGASREEGIGSWSEIDILNYLRSGKKPSGDGVDPRFCPVGYFGRAPLSELQAIAAYLHALPAAKE